MTPKFPALFASLLLFTGCATAKENEEVRRLKAQVVMLQVGLTGATKMNEDLVLELKQTKQACAAKPVPRPK